MKKLLFLFVFICSFACYPQSYRLIEKAEKKVGLKEYDKALKLLKRAETADYGFCGTAKIEALIAITHLRFQIFSETNDAVAMQKFLDEIDFFYEYSNVYSIERIRLAQMQFQNAELDQSIVNGLKIVTEGNLFEFGNLVPVKIDDSHALKLYFNSTDVWNLKDTEKISYNDALLKAYGTSDYYKLLHE